jgi:hypothetical protein
MHVAFLVAALLAGLALAILVVASPRGAMPGSAARGGRRA